MSQSGAHVVIIGAGHAGGTAAALLRQYGHEGPITLVGEEPIPPYQRPPLSKAWLKGEADADSLALKPLEFYAEAGIDFLPGVTATELKRAERIVVLSNGESISYDYLILATGMRHYWTRPAAGRDPLELVGPVRPEAPDRRPAVRRRPGAGPRRPRQRPLRRLPPEGRPDPGG